MGNCCSVQSENNHVNNKVCLKENTNNPGPVAQSDGTPLETEWNPMPRNGSQRGTVKGAVPRNEVHPVPVKTAMPVVYQDPDGRDCVKQDYRKKSTTTLPSTSSSDCQAKRAKTHECNRFGNDSNVKCSLLKEGTTVENCKETAEPNNEKLPRPPRSMDTTTPAPLSTSQDKAADQIGSEEQNMSKLKAPVSPIMAENADSDEDLYRGEDEIEKERNAKDGSCPRSQAELAPDGQCSVEDPVELLTYSQKEWRGNTTKSVLIRKGYEVISSEFDHLRRVRGDNYCALRATLFQLLTQSFQLPACIADQDVSQWPKELPSVQDLIDEWRFPFVSPSSTKGGVEQLAHYLQLLKTQWQGAVEAHGQREREVLCQQVFQGGEEEYGLLEALKFLMLRTAVELHGANERGESVPEFCWLLFARDTSHCPRTFLTNHLLHVGSSGGLEQVEMFLLGYSLQQTIQVYRLYKADTEEFITFYPDDHKDDWPRLVLLTEDDRHYNVPVQRGNKRNSSGKPVWLQPSGKTPMHEHPNHPGKTYV